MKTLSVVLISMLLFQGAPEVSNQGQIMTQESIMINKILNYGPTSNLLNEACKGIAIPQESLEEVMQHKLIETKWVNKST